MPNRLTVVVAAVLAALTIPSLASALTNDGPTDPRIPNGTAQHQLDVARAAWKAYGVHHYRIRIRTDCFCAPATRKARTIEVRDGKPVAKVPAHLRRYATVHRLFARIQEAIGNNVADLTATYDKHGVPQRIYIDVSRNIADEEHGVQIVGFHVLD